MFCICLPSVSQVNLTKSIQKNGQLTWFNQPNILRKQKSHANPTFQHQPVQVSESEPPESALEHPVVFFKRCGPPGPTGDFSQKKATRFATRKNCLEIFGELFFRGKWTLDVDQKIGKNGYMKEKSKVQRPLQK